MTIKWVKADPLVMNGEPFCYGTRLTVRNLLQMRVNGVSPGEMIAQHPELRVVGIANAFLYASQHRDRYPDFVEPDGSIRGPGFSASEVAEMPEDLRDAPPGVLVSPDVAAEPAPTAGPR
jgi:uncharacterized protein (DUF433 family)